MLFWPNLKVANRMKNIRCECVLITIKNRLFWPWSTQQAVSLFLSAWIGHYRRVQNSFLTVYYNIIWLSQKSCYKIVNKLVNFQVFEIITLFLLKCACCVLHYLMEIAHPVQDFYSMTLDCAAYISPTILTIILSSQVFSIDMAAQLRIGWMLSSVARQTLCNRIGCIVTLMWVFGHFYFTQIVEKSKI